MSQKQIEVRFLQLNC